MIKYAKKVYILEFFEEMKGDAITRDKLAQSGITEFITNVSVKEIKGTKFVEGLVYEDRKTGKDTEIKIQGVFISVGMEAKAGFAAKLVELNKIGEIVIDKDNNTKTPGLFAAGDITDIKYEQIVIACGEGAKAVLATTDYLKNK
jgi:alkyl hydroperoxide reductase subunit F